jgi:uncharacterized protein YndB with AHSA1/START domain
MEFIAGHIGVAAKVPKVLKAITTTAGFRGWWTECDVGRSPGESAWFRFGQKEAVFSIDRLDGRGIELICRRGDFPEWLDTRLSIRAVEDGNGTYVDLLHDGYPAKNHAYEECVAGWKHFLESLRAYCETGRGDPYTTTARSRGRRKESAGA